jgi:large subunit ribosomal protein L30
MSDQQKKPAKAGKAPAKAGEKAGKRIRVTLVKGLTGTIHKHRESVKGLGLRHREHTVEVADTPAIRGMINRVSYLVKVEE